MKKYFFIALMIIAMGALNLAYGVQPAAAAEKPQNGGTLRMGYRATSNVFGDPVEARGPGGDFLEYAGQALASITDKPGAYEPMLATSWELAPDKSSYTFHLRKGVKFHDGTDCNAQAIKWNHQRIKDSNRVSMVNITSIDVIDDYTIKYNLSQWDTTILYDLVRGSGAMVISPTAFESHDQNWVNTHPIGTGPYKFSSYKRNVFHKYERFDDYWGDKAYLDKWEIYMIPDPMTQIASLKKGEVEVLREVDFISASELKKEDKWNMSFISGGHMILWFDNQSEESVFSNLKVREAMEYAVDRKKIAASLGKGFIKPISEVLFGVTEAGNPGTKIREYNPEKAKQLLAEAGYPNGIKATLSTGTMFWSDFVVALMNDFEAVGIKLKIEKVEPAKWRDVTMQPVMPNTLLYDRERGGVASLLTSIKGDLATDSIYYPGVKRPDGWDNLLNKALQEEDPQIMIGFLEEMERKAYGEAMFTPLWDAPDIMVLDPKVQWEPWTDLRGSAWYAGGNPSIRVEHMWMKK